MIETGLILIMKHACNSDIVIKNYSSRDYNEIISSGYVFSPSYLEPSLLFKLSRYLSWTDWFTLVAYHKIKKMIAGVVTYIKYTNRIWITGPLFVSTDFRRMGVGSLLVQTANQVLKDREIRKAFGDVPKGNPVIKLHTELGMKLLMPMLHIWGRVDTLPYLKGYLRRIKVREAEVCDIPQLSETYQQSVTSSWMDFFEVDDNNFLNEYSRDIRMLPKLLKYKKIIAAEMNGKINGYSLIVLPRRTLFGKMAFSEIDIFVSSDHREEVTKTLVTESIRELNNRNITNLQLYLMSSSNDFMYIEEFLDHLNLNHLTHYCMAYFL